MRFARTVAVFEVGEPGLAAAARCLADDGLVIHPTETVVSLSGNPYSEPAVRRARRLKGYRDRRPFLVLVAGAGEARALAGAWPEAANRLAEALWPGPLTLVVPARADGPAPVLSEGRLALRPASDPVSLGLLSSFGGPIFSTSANRRGDAASTAVREAIASLGLETVAPESGTSEIVALRGSGKAGTGSPPSTLVDVTVEPPRLIRRGAISPDRIREILSGGPSG